MLRVKGLTKKYNKKYAVEKVSFNLDEGEIGVLLGPNGAGKSTVIKCILGLLQYDGEVKVDGLSTTSAEGRKILGYVPEIPALYERMTVREHFEFITRAYQLDPEKTREYASELVNRLRLNEVVDSFCKDLSKGMQQKVSIICALLPRPKILLLDEPMLGLDPHAIKELRLILTELAEDGVAILISTHLISTVEGMWQKAYIMRNGQILYTHRKDEMVGVWAESLERIFFAETESYDSPWQVSPEPRRKGQQTQKKNPSVSRPNTSKKKSTKKKKK
ncbi:MAG: ABC transporter ATP-binding protein [Clostridiales bacterium]|nr:ABC transporter ATP-binding protein [Clostridiales bacterium]